MAGTLILTSQRDAGGVNVDAIKDNVVIKVSRATGFQWLQRMPGDVALIVVRVWFAKNQPAGTISRRVGQVERKHRLGQQSLGDGVVQPRCDLITGDGTVCQAKDAIKRRVQKVIRELLRQAKTLIADAHTAKCNCVVSNGPLHTASAVLNGKTLIFCLERCACARIKLGLFATGLRSTAFVGYPDIAGAGIEYTSELLLV